MNVSLRRRLSAWLGAWILGVGLLAAALAFAIEYNGANKLQDTQLKQIAAVLALNPLPTTAMMTVPLPPWLGKKTPVASAQGFCASLAAISGW